MWLRDVGWARCQPRPTPGGPPAATAARHSATTGLLVVGGAAASHPPQVHHGHATGTPRGHHTANGGGSGTGPRCRSVRPAPSAPGAAASPISCPRSPKRSCMARRYPARCCGAEAQIPRAAWMAASRAAVSAAMALVRRASARSVAAWAAARAAVWPAPPNAARPVGSSVGAVVGGGSLSVAGFLSGPAAVTPGQEG